MAAAARHAMGFLSLILGSALVAGTAGFGAASLGLRRPTDVLLAAYVIGSAAVVVIALALSPFEWLTRAGLLAAAACVFLAVLAVWLWRGRPAPPPLRPSVGRVRDALRDPVLAVLAAAVTLALAYSAVLAVATPPNDYDSLWYHLARAAFWSQEHAVEYLAAPNDLRLNVFPPVAEIPSAWAMTLEGSERYASLVQLVALIATVVAIAGIGRRIGLPLRTALFGALLFASLPVVALQAATPLNDIVVCAYLLVAAYFLVSDGRFSLLLGALSLALAIGTKGTALIALPVLLAVAAVLCPPRRLALAVGAGAAGLVAGSFWYFVNLSEKGKLIPQFAPGNPEQHVDDETVLRIPALVARMAVDAVDPAGSVGRDRWVYAGVAIALVILGAFLAAGRGRRAPLVGAAVAAAVVLTPIAFPWLHDLIHRGYQRTLLELDEPGLAFVGLAREAEPPSPFISWYGALGLLLVLAATPLTVREIRRGSLRRGALILPLIPIVYVVLVVVTLAYSPFHGRYVMPAVALAAVTFGLVDTVRPLAWAASAIAVVTLVLAFVHYEEKPAGFSVLGDTAPDSVWTEPRIDVLARSRAPGGAAALLQLEQLVRDGETVALAIRQDDVSYPFFGADLDRRVVFVGNERPLGGSEDWLVVAPGVEATACASGWQREPEVEPGWSLYRRVGLCPGESASS
jgi:hypothetical protein